MNFKNRMLEKRRYGGRTMKWHEQDIASVPVETMNQYCIFILLMREIHFVIVNYLRATEGICIMYRNNCFSYTESRKKL